MRHIKNQRGFAVLEVIVLVGLLAILGFVGYRAYQERQAKPAETTVEKKTSESKRVTSGKGKFSIELPDGWKFLRPLDSDWFLTEPGCEQPTFKEGVPALVKDMDSFGGDGCFVFDVLVYNNFSKPTGTSADFEINDLKGKKYVASNVPYMASGNFIAKTYEYRFDMGSGYELVASYNVYEKTHKDQHELIEKTIKTIRIEK